MKLNRKIAVLFLVLFPVFLSAQYNRDRGGDVNVWTRTGDGILSPKTTTDDVLIFGKLDLGAPGSSSGLDVGEGGSYTTDANGVTIVYAYKYDASEDGGSRFTSLTLNASNTWLGDQGDRLYVGSTKKFWAARFNLTQAKTTEVLEAFYWNGSLTAMDHMGILKTSATTTGESVLEQTSEKEYVTWDKDINSDWVAVDDQTDTIPNVGLSVFWICLLVPSGGLTTPVISSEIKARGTDFDFVSGASYPIFWGQARVERHERIPLGVVKSPGGTTTATIDITSAHKQLVFDFDGAGDNLSFMWTIPEGTDTSCPIEVKISYSADANDTFTIDLDALKMTNALTIGSGVSADYTSTTNITAAAASKIYTEVTLMATKMSIKNLAPGDIISFELQRTDASNSFYPMSITLHYVVYSTGEHV